VNDSTLAGESEAFQKIFCAVMEMNSKMPDGGVVVRRKIAADLSENWTNFAKKYRKHNH